VAPSAIVLLPPPPCSSATIFGGNSAHGDGISHSIFLLSLYLSVRLSVSLCVYLSLSLMVVLSTAAVINQAIHTSSIGLDVSPLLDGSCSPSLRIGAPRASVDFSCVFLLFLLLFCAARLASRLELRRRVRTRRDARKP
jgi:hypothetical protein